MSYPSASQQNSTSGRLFRSILAVLCGLAMACALLALVALFPPTRFQYAVNMLRWLLIGGLLYFAVPFGLSFWISWRTGQKTIGYHTGMLTAWTTAILVLLTFGVTSVISAITPQYPQVSVDRAPLSNTPLILLFLAAIVLHGCGCLIASGER